MQRAPHNNIVATPDYEEWKYFRKMTNFAFSPENIRKVGVSESVCPFAKHVCVLSRLGHRIQSGKMPVAREKGPNHGLPICML